MASIWSPNQNSRGSVDLGFKFGTNNQSYNLVQGFKLWGVLEIRCLNCFLISDQLWKKHCQKSDSNCIVCTGLYFETTVEWSPPSNQFAGNSRVVHNCQMRPTLWQSSEFNLQTKVEWCIFSIWNCRVTKVTIILVWQLFDPICRQ